ncbi:unnamed protein product, partial [Iphiclides podalirius]
MGGHYLRLAVGRAEADAMNEHRRIRTKVYVLNVRRDNRLKTAEAGRRADLSGGSMSRGVLARCAAGSESERAASLIAPRR